MAKGPSGWMKIRVLLAMQGIVRHCHFPSAAFSSCQDQTACGMLIFNQTLMRARASVGVHRRLRSTLYFALQRLLGAS
jgi:hypothetical protein